MFNVLLSASETAVKAVADPIADMLGEWSKDVNVWSVLLRVLLSVTLSAIIGCERSSKRHAAGLRTFMLVSLTATVAMMLDVYMIELTDKGMYLISAASVVAIAILSANSILFSSRSQIKGLTTSVGLWSCGLLGLAIGAGLYTVTAVVFVALMCCLSLFPSIEKYLKNRSNHFEVHLELKNIKYLQDFVTTIRKLGMRIDDIECNQAYVNSGLSVYSVSITVGSEELKKYKTHEEIIKALSTLDYVYHIEEMN
ncbi:MAG: MgtC/SapB family protein [Firmicutes bacterium]|nr:MgtC/SapB family protein [Bacillota bacterium]MDY5530983.1 MgtC/SapB family protein [Pumilibacteraceae bacterium]